MFKRASLVFAVLAATSGLIGVAALVPQASVGGTVKKVSGNRVTVAVGSAAATEDQTFTITGDTKITLDGKPAKLAALTEGTRVTLSYDKITREVVSVRVRTAAASPATAPKESDSASEPKSATTKPERTAKTKPNAAGKSTAAVGEWPQWRGPDRSGVSKETGLLKQWPSDGPPLAWTASGMGRGHASLAVAGGRAYVSGGRGGSQNVTCVNVADGSVVWSEPIGRPGDEARSTPTVDGDLLYVLSTRGNQDAEIVCLEIATGKEQWRKNFRGEFNGRMMSSWGYSESPLVDGDHVICTPGGSDATLVALQKKTGDVVWKAKVPGGDAAGYASAVVAEVGGVRQYVQLLERGIVGVAARDGKFLWRYDKIANGTANIPTPIVQGDLVFCSTGYGTGAALLKLTGGGGGTRAEERYFLPGNTFQNHHGGMVLIGDYIYAGSGHNNGLPTCIEMKSGKIAWGPERGPGAESAAIAYADGHVYFRYQNAVMALVEATPRGLKVKGSFKIPNGSTPSWSHPVIAGGRLYLRDQDVLHCYDISAAGAARAAAN